MTIKEALNVSSRSVSFREAEILLQHVLSVDRAWLHAHPEDTLSDGEAIMYEDWLKRRENNEPVAYIIGYKEFYGRDFHTDPRVLIPRPETEKLIDLALEWGPKHFYDHLRKTNKPCPLRILELGTGSGNIAVTLALELAEKTTPAEIIATEIAPEALELAQENWQLLRGDSPAPSPKFVIADLFDHEAIEAKKPYDLIIANLPYVPNRWKFAPEAQAEVVFKEPDVALFGGEDGLDIYRRFFKEAPKFLANEGLILIEYGEDQTADMKPLAREAFPDFHLAVYPDYAGLDRVLEIKRVEQFWKSSVTSPGTR